MNHAVQQPNRSNLQYLKATRVLPPLNEHVHKPKSFKQIKKYMTRNRKINILWPEKLSHCHTTGCGVTRRYLQELRILSCGNIRCIPTPAVVVIRTSRALGPLRTHINSEVLKIWVNFRLFGCRSFSAAGVHRQYTASWKQYTVNRFSAEHAVSWKHSEATNMASLSIPYERREYLHDFRTP